MKRILVSLLLVASLMLSGCAYYTNSIEAQSDNTSIYFQNLNTYNGTAWNRVTGNFGGNGTVQSVSGSGQVASTGGINPVISMLPLTSQNVTDALGYIPGSGSGTVISVNGSGSIHSTGGINPIIYQDAITSNNVTAALGFTPENVANKSDNASLGTSTTLYPTERAVKEYVDNAVTGSQWNFFLDRSSGGISGYYLLTQTQNATTSNFTKTGLAAGSNQLLFKWTTNQTLPFQTIQAGVTEMHLHIAKTAGTKDLQIYGVLYERKADTSEVALFTTETSALITGNTSVDLHAVIPSSVDLLTGDNLDLEVYANVSGGGSNVDTSIYSGGSANSYVGVEAPGTILVSSVTGTSPITTTGSNSVTVSIATAGTATTGALSSTDWNTFNGKQDVTASYADVWQSNNQVIANNTYTYITFNQEFKDSNSLHSTTTNTGNITVDTSGWYSVGLSVVFPGNANGSRAAFISINGTATNGNEQTYQREDASNGNAVGIAYSYPLYLNSTDIISIEVYQNSGGNLTLYGSVGAFNGLCPRLTVVRIK